MPLRRRNVKCVAYYYIIFFSNVYPFFTFLFIIFVFLCYFMRFYAIIHYFLYFYAFFMLDIHRIMLYSNIIP